MTNLQSLEFFVPEIIFVDSFLLNLGALSFVHGNFNAGPNCLNI